MKNIIIGGTHGLGKEIAKKLQALGEETFTVGRSYDEARHGEGMRVDLSEAGEAEELAGQVRGLGATAVNFYWVAGYNYGGDFAKQKLPGEMAAVNFGNVLPAAQEAFRTMLTLKVPSHFVVISSTTGFRARANSAVYAGTKHAQVGFTRSLGLEAERLASAVRVALFMPGGMQTPFWEGSRPPAYAEFLDPEKVADHIITAVRQQDTAFYEEVIERGRL